MNGLDALIEPGQEVTLCTRGETVTIRPINVGLWPYFARAIDAIKERLIRLATGDAADLQAELFALLLEQPDAVIQAVAVAARMERTAVDTLELDDLAVLLLTILAVNADFFARRLIPRLTGPANASTGSPPPSA